MTEYIAESRNPPSSPGAHDCDHMRSTPSKHAQPLDRPPTPLVPSVRLQIDSGHTQLFEGMSEEQEL